MRITIGRNTGPCTDQEVTTDFDESQIEAIKDVIAMVNEVGRNKEGWYVGLPDGSYVHPKLSSTPPGRKT